MAQHVLISCEPNPFFREPFLDERRLIRCRGEISPRTKQERLPSMSFLRSSLISEGCFTRPFADQPANNQTVYPLRL